jgi:hypothetical protein
MKRIMILIAALFLVAPMFCNEVSFSQSASYLNIADFSDDDKYIYVADKSFGSNTNINLTTDYVNASVTAAFHKNYKAVNASINPHYAINDIVTLEGNIVYNLSNVDYTSITKVECNVTDQNLVANVGISLQSSFWIFDVKVGAYVGYNPFYYNFKNLCETMFNINIDISKYVSVYFAIESFQESVSFANFYPQFVKNTYGVNVHYTFNNGITVFASYDYFCAHPEKPWKENIDLYNKCEGFATLGIKYALPF